MKKTITFILWIALALVLTGCGAGGPVEGFKSDSSQSLASQENSSAPQDPNFSPTAPCQIISGGGFRGRTQAFKLNGTTYTETQQVRIDLAPQSFVDSRSVLQFSSGSSREGTSKTVRFYLEDRQTQMPVSGMISSISATDLATFAKNNYGQALPAAQMLSRVNFVLIEVPSLNKTSLRLTYFQNEAPVGLLDFQASAKSLCF